MSTRLIRACALATGLTVIASGAFAQTAASAPAAVGVTPATAAAAADKAVPRNDTATLVRTGPTATDRAGNMRPSGNGMTTGGTAGTMGTSSGTSGTATGSMAGTGGTAAMPAQRAARADRN